MDKTQSIKLIQSQKSPTSASLQEKLFLESIEKSIQSPKSTKNTNSSTNLTRSKRVEDSLISSKLKTQSKINLMQIKKNKEIMETLQSTPRINQTSRALASAQSTPSLKSKYISSLVFSSKLYKLNKLYQRGLIYKAKICLDHLDLRPSNCKSPSSYKISRSSYTSENLHKKMLENYYSRDKNKRITKSKVSKSKNTLIHLDPLARSEAWIKQKNQNLAKIKQEIEEMSLQHCTFSPELSPKSKNWKFNETETSLTPSLSFSPVSPLMSTQNAFRESSIKQAAMTQRMETSERIERMDRSHGMNGFSLEEIEKGNKRFFSVSLSPHNRKVAFRSGMNWKDFKSNARPMVRYASPTPFYYWNRVLRECLVRY